MKYKYDIGDTVKCISVSETERGRYIGTYFTIRERGMNLTGPYYFMEEIFGYSFKENEIELVSPLEMVIREIKEEIGI